MMIDGVNPYHFKEFSAKSLGRAQKSSTSPRCLPCRERRYMAIKAEEQTFAKKYRYRLYEAKAILPRFIIRPYRWRTSRLTDTRNRYTQATDITVDDFNIINEHPEKGLDIIGVCRK
jgi:hypothetical protein